MLGACTVAAEEVAEEEEEVAEEEEVTEEGWPRRQRCRRTSAARVPTWGVDAPPAARLAVSGRRRDLNLPGYEREADGRDRRRREPQPDAATRPRRVTPGGHRVATSRRLED